MAQSYKGHWKVYGPPGFKGKVHGIRFVDGFAYVNWKTLGEHETQVALQRLGEDPNFNVIEIAEQDSEWGSK